MDRPGTEGGPGRTGSRGRWPFGRGPLILIAPEVPTGTAITTPRGRAKDLARTTGGIEPMRGTRCVEQGRLDARARDPQPEFLQSPTANDRVDYRIHAGVNTNWGEPE